MKPLFTKHFWLAQATFVTFAALLVAGATNGFAAASLARHSVAFPSDTPDDHLVLRGTETFPAIPPSVFGPPARPGTDAAASSPDCESDPTACDGPDEDASAAPTDGCVESDIGLTLVGTMVASDEAWSVAILRNQEGQSTHFARVGSALLAEGYVTAIERSRVTLTRNGRTECLRSGDRTERSRRTAATPPVRESTGPPAEAPSSEPNAMPSTSRPPRTETVPQTLDERVGREVHQDADGRYVIPRALLRDAASDEQALRAHAPTIAPYFSEGRAAGLRLTNLPPGSIFEAIGLRNGDVIRGANGTALTSPLAALELYEAMLSEDAVELRVLRRDNEHTLRYAIR